MTKYCGVKMAMRFARILNIGDLGFTTDKEYEDHVEELVEAASRFIDDYCRRPYHFFNGGATVADEKHSGIEIRDSDYPNLPYVGVKRGEEKRRTFYLAHYPVITMSDVYTNDATIGDADDWTVVAATSYRVDGKTGILKFAFGSIPREGFDNVRFRYTAGYATTPKVVELTCAELVGNRLKAGVEDRSAQYTRMTKPQPISFESPNVFTKELQERLSRYIKRR